MTLNPTVAALNSLSIFGAHQAAAYREHAESALAVLGELIPTRLSAYVTEWAKGGSPGLLVLTGNAGTGKTALAEIWSVSQGSLLPADDGLQQVEGTNNWVVKDLSGVRPTDRRAIIALATDVLEGAREGQLFLCANEGLLRDELDAESEELTRLLASAIDNGFSRSDGGRGTVLNLNRQRWTSPELWNRLLDYLTRPELWEDCNSGECGGGDNCPLGANAAALRVPETREALRTLIQLASGSTVATLRELLSLLSLAITGGMTCEDAGRGVARARIPDARIAYFNLVFGSTLASDRAERSNLLQAINEAEVGFVADLEVDGWLRDASVAPAGVEGLADDGGPHSLVQTGLGPKTFAEIGELLTVSDDAEAVRVCRQDFSEGANALSLWRRRVFIEAGEALGGRGGAVTRLTSYSFFAELLSLAEDLRSGTEPADERRRLITGLNYLAAGFHAYAGALIVPDSGSLSARNPGAFRRPDPSVVRGDVPVSQVTLRLEDASELNDYLDTDDVRVVLEVSRADSVSARLLLTPRLYQVIRESNDYRAPVGSEIPEMAELALFYAQLAGAESRAGLQIVDPVMQVIQDVTLPSIEDQS